MTGVVDKRAGCIHKVVAEKTDRLVVAPVFTQPVSEPLRPKERLATYHPTSPGVHKYRTLHFLRTFGQIGDHTAFPGRFSPQNCLSLESNTHLAFRLFKWTLVATEVRSAKFGLGLHLYADANAYRLQIPIRYQVRTYDSPDQRFGTGHINEFVTFTERSGQSGTLLDPNSLRAHAIFASVLHLSGLGFMFDPEWWIPEELQASKMSSEQRLLPSPGRALLQKIYGTCSQPRRWVELREDAMPVS